jgi:predicted kinase
MGAPGSGKSSYVQNHLNSLRVISCDEIREKEFGYERSYRIRFFVLEIMLDEIKAAYETGRDFVVDSTYFNEGKTRKRLFRYIPASAVSVVFLNPGLDACLRQNSRRLGHRRVEAHMIEYLHECLDSPSEEEGFQTLNTID